MSESSEIFSKVPELGYREVAPATDPQAFARILEARRSVRVYDQTPVPERVMREVLEWTLMAPNSSNLQCWEFYWVRNPEKKKELAKYCFNQPAAKTAQELIVAVARPSHWKKHAKQMVETFKTAEAQGQKIPKSAWAYYQKLAPFVYTQGPLSLFGYIKKVLFFFRGFTAVTPREPTDHKGMALWASKSCALACENFMLGMAAHGFDTCPMEGFDSRKVKKLLNLKRSDEVTMVISVGKRGNNGVYGPRVRFPSTQFIKEV
ncbi:MAG: nitroreductase family protein [Bacteriovoracaceae bacterium]|nr:nitroreductase family protein [Bacteriovoracaceae bacterium]